MTRRGFPNAQLHMDNSISPRYIKMLFTRDGNLQVAFVLTGEKVAPEKIIPPRRLRISISAYF